MSAGDKPIDEAVQTAKRLEWALASMEEQFFMLDRDWRYVYVNPRVLETLQRPTDALLGRSIWDLFPHLLDSPFHTALHEVIAEQRPRRFELFHAAANSWLENVIFPTLDGVAVLVRDVTPRKHMEETLRHSEERLRTLADAIPTFIWSARPDGHVDYFNRQALDFLGRPLHELQGDAWLAAIHPDDRERMREAAARAIATGEPYEVDYRIFCVEDGVYHWHLTRAKPLRDEQGEIIRWYGACTDIEGRKQAEEALRHADRVKDEFLATLAHELRNPLAPILNAVQFLQMRSPSDEPDLRRAREMIERQVHHMVRLVNDLLDVSRITLGRIHLQRERIDLRTVIATAVESSQPLMENLRHEFTMALPPEPIHVEADATRLSQVLLNLLDNAAKYTPQGGRIELTASRNGDEAQVRIKDSGIGIQPEKLPRIFEMFTQVHDSGYRTQGGLGIGLTLAQRLAQLHGGRLTAHSEGLGKGSVFVLHLPVIRERKTIVRASLAGDRSGRGAHHRVLIVDDNVDAVESLSMTLQVLGHETHAAYGGTEALQAVERLQPDMVLLDIGLPDMDGYEVARQLRSQPGGEHLLLVALTGWGQDEDKRLARAAGFDHHLTKPVELSQLEALLQGPAHNGLRAGGRH